MNNENWDVFGKEDALVVDPSGYAKIIRHLAAQTFTPNDSRLHFNETVSEMHYELENDQNMPSGLPNNGVYVKTTEGNK